MRNKKVVGEGQKVIWSDRKRHLGLPISFTKYVVDNDRLYMSKGFFTTVVDEILLYRILDIKMSRNLLQKLFGVGTIHLYSADRTDRHLDLINVSHPNDVRRMLSHMVEKIREAKKLTGREIYGTAGMMGPMDMMGENVEDDMPDFMDHMDSDI